MERILITGGAGFIGSNMADAFLEKGYDVSILDNFSTGNSKNIQQIKSKIEIHKGDMCDDSLLQKAVKNCDYVFHLAALRSVPKSFNNPEEYERYENFKAAAKKRFFEIVEEIQARNKNVSFKKVYKEITEAVEEVRSKRYAQQKQAKNRS